jgi:uncharacterized protein Usg
MTCIRASRVAHKKLITPAEVRLIAGDYRLN